MNVRAQTSLVLDAASLARAKPGVRRPAYDRNAVGIGIVHIGTGAFHRAHQACFVDDLLDCDPRWGICGVSLRTAGVRNALAPQDNLYTLAILDDPLDSKISETMRIV